MKKLVLLIALTMLCSGIVKAQFKLLSEGPVFEEPQEGYAKLIQLKTGYTIFIHLSAKKGNTVIVYNAAHQEVGVKDMEPAFGKITQNIESAFELNGNVVLMVNTTQDKMPTLFRLVIDGKTGVLIEEKKIAQLNKFSIPEYSINFGYVHNFYIRKDPLSDNYAVAMLNNERADMKSRMEIISYGAFNQETGRALYTSPEEKYKYINFVDMAVIGSDKVCMLTYGYNTRRSGGKASELIMANLDKGSSTVNYTELDFSKNLEIHAGLTRYNPVTQSLILLALVKVDHKQDGLTPVAVFINPFERKINRLGVISPSERLDKYVKGGFRGLPQNLFVNEDGTFTVISEELTTLSTSSKSAILGNAAIVTYSSTGEFLTDHLIRKNQTLSYIFDIAPFYLAKREGDAQYLKEGNQYKSFSYINGNYKSYVLFNDTERNNDNLEKGSLVSVYGVSGSDAFYYPVKGIEPILTRDYLFGNPEKKKDHNLALFCISDYDKKSNIYTTLKLENEGGKKGVRVVWFQP